MFYVAWSHALLTGNCGAPGTLYRSPYQAGGDHCKRGLRKVKCSQKLCAHLPWERPKANTENLLNWFYFFGVFNMGQGCYSASCFAYWVPTWQLILEFDLWGSWAVVGDLWRGTGDGENFSAIRKVIFFALAGVAQCTECRPANQKSNILKNGMLSFFPFWISDFNLSWPLAPTCLREIRICYRRNGSGVGGCEYWDF